MGMGEWSRGPTIGRGSSATVSLGSSPRSGKVFAVKTAELSCSGPLQREQRILSAFNCLNIISYLGFEITSDALNKRLYYNLFMEYAPGGSLSDQIKKHGGRLSEPAIRSHTREILGGLAYLHSHRLAHCDIKGQNILIGSDGQAKIADFGCARRVDGDRERPMSGTPMFMAPEVARGEEQGPAADVWAVGCTILEMATGQPPWPAVYNPVTTLNRIAFSSDVPRVPRWVSNEGKDFLDKCLRRDPKERWTADQLLKHPFVVVPADYISTRSSNLDGTTPKSPLDQDMWKTLSEEEGEGELEGQTSDGPRQRILQLASGSHAGPNWACDDNWVTIRSDNREWSILSKPEEEKHQFSTEDLMPTIPVDVSLHINRSRSSLNREDFLLNSHDCVFHSNVRDSPSVVVAAEEGGEEGNKLFHCEKNVISFCSNSLYDKQSIMFELSERFLVLIPAGSFLLSTSFIFWLCCFRRLSMDYQYNAWIYVIVI